MKRFIGTLKHLLIGLLGMLLVIGGWLVQIFIHVGITVIISLAISFSIKLLFNQYVDFTYIAFSLYTLLAAMWYFKANLSRR